MNAPEGEYEDENEYEDGNATGIFGSLKRAVGVDTNQFRASAKYKTHKGTERSVDITQADSFAAMMSQTFFNDLLHDGPLVIDTLSISSEKPDSTYHVHPKLVKSFDDLIEKYEDHGLTVSVVKQLNIALKIDPKEAAKFNDMLIKIATLFNIKYEKCTYNGQSSDALSMRHVDYSGPHTVLQPKASSGEAGLLKTAYKAAVAFTKTDSSQDLTTRVNAVAQTKEGQALIEKVKKMKGADQGTKQTTFSVGLEDDPDPPADVPVSIEDEPYIAPVPESRGSMCVLL